MDRRAFRAVIFHLCKSGKTPKEIKDELDSTYGDSAPSHSTVCSWVNECKRGRTCLDDEPRCGRPKSASDAENVEKVRLLVIANRRVTLAEIAQSLKISSERVHKILHQDLQLKKISARWVPRLLTADQKATRVRTSRDGLNLIHRDPDDFWRRLITVDETWVHHFTPETKEASKQWLGKGDNPPVKAKVVPSAGKVMATVFWDCSGIIHIDYLEKGRTITGQYYATVLDKVNDAIRENRPGLKKKKILFLHDNAPAHKSAVATEKLRELGYHVIEHPPYSPDLAPCDFFLFSKLKNFLAGKKFSSNNDVIDAVNAYFNAQGKSFFSEGMKRLEFRWNKCIEVGGDYVEK